MEKERFEINFKGEVNSLVRKPFDYGHYDFELAYSTIKFYGTQEELDKFIEEISDQEKYFKVIGIVNLADTLVEITEAVDEYGYITGEMLVTDLYENSKGYYLSKQKTESLLDEKGINRLYEYNYNYPKRFWVRKDKLIEVVNN